MKTKLISLVFLLSVSTFSWASIRPPEDTLVEYIAHISDVDNCFHGSLDSGSYDFYKIDVFARHDVTFELFSTDLIPNVAIYDHFADPGDTIGDLGQLLFLTNNRTSSDLSEVTWSPPANFWATVVVTTTGSESGDYTLKVDGAAAINPMMPMPAAVPEPASAFIWTGMLGAAISLWWKRSRRS